MRFSLLILSDRRTGADESLIFCVTGFAIKAVGEEASYELDFKDWHQM